MGQPVHVIPVVVEVHGARTREEAFEIVRRGMRYIDEGDLPGKFEHIDRVIYGFPNDDWDGHWHLEFVQGPPPEDLDDTATYTPGKGIK